MRAQDLALLLPAILLGCPPALNNDDDDITGDDDDATGDDDDITGDDDDATGDDDDITGDDDDDIIDVNCEGEIAGIQLSSPTGFNVEGSWYEGDLRLEGDTVIVTQADGNEVEFRSSLGALTLSGLQGSGRVFWQTPMNTFAATDAILAVEGWSPWFRAVHANTAVLPESVASEWAFWTSASGEACGEGRVEECGVSYGTPLDWTFTDISDGQFYELQLFPGESFGSGSGAFIEHRGGRVWQDVTCLDWPFTEYAWTYFQLFDGVIIGVN